MWYHLFHYETAQIPAYPPIVAISAALFCGALFAGGVNNYEGPDNGDWSADANWSQGHVPRPDEDVGIGGMTVNAPGSINVKSLHLIAATLYIGDKTSRPHIAPVIDGDLTLVEGSKLYVYAGELTDYDVFETDAKATEAIRAAANIVTISGDFTVEDTSVVYPECGEITGVPVIFKVDGDFTLDEGASFNATKRGWGWMADEWGKQPTYAKPCRGEAAWKAQGWTFAFGPAFSYAGSGSNYGFASSGTKQSRDGKTYCYCQSYGYSFAPFLPGSPSSGHYATTLDAFRSERGPGSIVILCQGTATVDGLMNANGLMSGAQGSSGGGIMLAAQAFEFGESASLTAEGGGASGAFKPGYGGRIALLTGFLDGELTDILKGDLPSDAVVSDSITLVPASVVGGLKNGSRGGSGTCATILSAAVQATLTTQSDVPGLSAAGVVWGDQVLMNGSYEFTAPQYAVLADDPGIRYTCKGYVVSNSTQQIAWGGGLTATVEIDGHYGPFTLTWKWGDRTEIDPDPVTRHWVGPTGGDFSNAANWDPSGVPTRVDTLYLTGAKVVATRLKAANLIISGGTLTLGSSEGREDFEFNVTGDVEIGDGATVNVYAPLKSDPAEYTTKDVARGLLWQNRTTVTVGGTLSVSDGSTVKVANHPETGDLVVFEVGAFDLAAGCTVTAEGTGFTWLPKGTKTLPSGTIVKEGPASVDGKNYTPCYTYAFGCISGDVYGTPANHNYGLDFAPFEPGSSGNVYNNAKISRGGGSIVVFAKGAVTLNGTLNADAVLNGGYSGPSGGSIWIAGATIDRGDGLVVTACGKASSNGNYGSGAGGRVAFMTDVTTDEQIERMVGGEKLEGYTYETMTFGGLAVDPGRRTPTSEPTGTKGTAVSAFDALNYETVTVTASPLEAVSSSAKYGSFQAQGGQTIMREADIIGNDPSDPQNVRYICTGYVVSNAMEQVAEGRTTTLSFTVVKGEGPYTVTWQWGIRETRTQLSVTGPGTVTMNGLDVDKIWVPDTEDVVFAATPDAEKAFWTWIGADIPEADAAKAFIAIPAAKPHVVRAVFTDLKAEAKTCTAKSSAKGDFYDPANWTDGIVPNPQDALVLSGGTLTAARRFGCTALTMTGGSLSVAGTDEIAIPGDVLFSGNATWSITALPTNTATAFADGSTRVTVDGDFSVTGTASVRPVSDAYTGGSVVFNVQTFTLGEGAKVNADGAGYCWQSATRPPQAPGRGNSYTIGGGYGGKGGGANATYGKTYGSAMAPIKPGSPNGSHSSDYRAAGGLIRIHARTMSIAGTVTANSAASNGYGGPSGGGIWLTADSFDFAETAKFSATGGNSGNGQHAYWSQGGGGRIAIETGLTDGQFERLLETGKIGRKAYGEETFTNRFSGVTVDVGGGYETNPATPVRGNKGTFVYMPEPPGLMLLVK